jgi:hypothetical protein
VVLRRDAMAETLASAYALLDDLAAQAGFPVRADSANDQS